MDAFDSALAIIKSNGSYEAIFAAELSSGIRMSHTSSLGGFHGIKCLPWLYRFHGFHSFYS